VNSEKNFKTFSHMVLNSTLSYGGGHLGFQIDIQFNIWTLLWHIISIPNLCQQVIALTP